VTPERIRFARSEAVRFIERATALLKTAHAYGKEEFVDSGKLSGALRRSSLDLTRALAEMRKP
jgi:GT2 family glycosyltransferase